jgi:hypothetical protein
MEHQINNSHQTPTAMGIVEELNRQQQQGFVESKKGCFFNHAGSFSIDADDIRSYLNISRPNIPYRGLTNADSTLTYETLYDLDARLFSPFRDFMAALRVNVLGDLDHAQLANPPEYLQHAPIIRMDKAVMDYRGGCIATADHIRKFLYRASPEWNYGTANLTLSFSEPKEIIPLAEEFMAITEHSQTLLAAMASQIAAPYRPRQILRM